MPSVDLICKACDHTFSRVVFKGDETPEMVCPHCGSGLIETALTSESLFDGIASFSRLSTDVN